MTARKVTGCKQDTDGDIIAICNYDEHWSPRLKDQVIEDIESKNFEYYVQSIEGQKTILRIINGISGKYLRSTHDSSSPCNLNNLPVCR